MTDITYPTLPAVHFTYDADGRRVSMTDGTSSTATTWTYGDGLHLTQQGSARGSVFYGYDADGRRQTMGAPGVNPSNSQAQYIYGYDAGGRLTSLENPFSETTSFGYNPDDTLAKKTLANGLSLVYGYDAAAQLIALSFGSQAGAYSHRYSYTPGGSVQTVNQGWYTTTYAYDGADQLTGESSTGGYPPPTLGYTYDHNGNRLTQTSNGTQTQSFTYDAHDKLVSGTAGSETDTYDKNGSETSISLSGSVYRFTYDDEDRLVQGVYPGGTNTFTYNGLGLRVGKTDSTGTYSYFCDGASPGSAVLSDGHTVYTPGLSENKGGVSSYAAYDVLGNLWFLDNGSGQQTHYQDTSGFGTPLGGSGTGSLFGYGGGSGCQTDGDIGLVLMGHRYYDTRIGRFVSQDHAKSGGNWYRYAGNNPVNKTDPSGLSDGLPGSLGAPDSHYGGLGGFLDGGAAGFDGNTIDSKTSNLDYSWFNETQAAYAAPPKPQPVDDNHSAWDHYLGKTGTPMSVNVKDLPEPIFDLTGAPSVYQQIMDGNVPPGYTFPIDTNVDLNFQDDVIGRAEGHFIGTLTMEGGYAYSLDGKLFVYPDTYKFNNDPNRGFIGNAVTNATRSFGNLMGGGTDFTVYVNGYIPVHQHNGD